MEVRIQKWLSQLGVASRRQAEQWVVAGRISVNGENLTQLGQKVIPGKDIVKVDGIAVDVKTPPRVYWMLNKPGRYLCSRAVQGKKTTIYQLDSLKDSPFRLFSIGRLDFLTEGLLLMTNDGSFAHQLAHPKFHVPRYYQVLVAKQLSDRQLQQLKKGIVLADGKVSGVKIQFLHREQAGGRSGFWYRLEVFEGRNRLVRRLFEHLGVEVRRLIRDGFGPVKLPADLAPGRYRQLTSKEIRSLKNSALGL